MKKTFLWIGGVVVGVILLVTWMWLTIEPRLDASSLPSQGMASPSLANSLAGGQDRMLARTFVADAGHAGDTVPYRQCL